MTAMGHEQTSCHVRVMSVIPLKADIQQRGLHVRLVPLADLSQFRPESPTEPVDTSTRVRIHVEEDLAGTRLRPSKITKARSGP